MNNAEDIVKCYEMLRSELKVKDLEAVMRGDTWARAMGLMADKFNSISARANSESDVATQIDAEILAFSHNVLEPSGRKGFDLKKERKVQIETQEASDTGEIQRSSAIGTIGKNGRIDSKYSSVVIEYKQKVTYKNNADTNKALAQAVDYLNSLFNENEGTYLGIITDGTRCQFVLFNEQIKVAYDKDHSDIHPLTAVCDLNAKMVDRMIRAIINLQVKALNSENLIADLVHDKHDGKTIVNHLTIALYKSLEQMDNVTSVSYGQWMNNFGLSHDDASKQKAIEDRRKDLAELIEREKIGTDEEYKILFSLQTAIAILAMLMAYRVVILVKGQRRASFQSLLEMKIDQKRIELGKIAEGTVSMELNIYNLLETGCFSWPFHETHWTEEINNCVNDIIETLMKYETMPEFNTRFDDNSELVSHTDDLFRDLYMNIMPPSVRHSLGEYYTPEFLAENVIDTGLDYIPFDKEHIRVLDSTAGSGTFIQKAIEKKRRRYKDLSREDALRFILNEVAAIDANTLAVILARINYFLAIADLIDSVESEIYIPVYIGDSSVPTVNKLTPDHKYYIDTIQVGNGESIKVEIPVRSTMDQKKFIDEMHNISLFGDASDEVLSKRLDKLCENEQELDEIIGSWKELKENNLITPAVMNSMINSYLLCNIGKFYLVVGNPPWVDWKTLPSVHRENKKEVCYARRLFSGDGRTGGNSLNICALISNVTAENWLAPNGVMSILMPQSLLFQQSYEGYREFELFDGRKLYFQEIIDWSKSGHPFAPVQQLFCTYVISEAVKDYTKGITLKHIELVKGYKLDNIKALLSSKNFHEYFTVKIGVVGKASNSRSAFTYAKNAEELAEFNLVTGETDYIGREGVEYYPQELQLLHLRKINEESGTVELESFDSTRSKIKVGKRTPELETKYLRPLVKGINISRFHIDPSEFIVAFPYDEEHSQVPLSKEELLEESPRLLKYYETNKEYLTVQTEYSDKIIGKKEAPYYALARTGIYCHADWYVIFRDNTKWVAAVSGKIDTEWGGIKKPAFQNHCVSVCQRADGSFITEDEAHYLCAILNSHIVEDYILSTSDKRTFKIRIPVRIMEYDAKNEIHVQLAELSKAAHEKYADLDSVEKLRDKIDKLYIQSLS